MDKKEKKEKKNWQNWVIGYLCIRLGIASSRARDRRVSLTSACRVKLRQRERKEGRKEGRKEERKEGRKEEASKKKKIVPGGKDLPRLETPPWPACVSQFSTSVPFLSPPPPPPPSPRVSACSRLKLDGDWKRYYHGTPYNIPGERIFPEETPRVSLRVTKLFTRSDGKFYFPFEYVFYVHEKEKERERERERKEEGKRGRGGEGTEKEDECGRWEQELEENCTMTTGANPFSFLSFFLSFFPPSLFFFFLFFF